MLLLGSSGQSRVAETVKDDDLDKRSVRAAIAPDNSPLVVVFDQHRAVVIRAVTKPVRDYHMAIALEVEAGKGTFRQLVAANLADDFALRVEFFEEARARAGGA